MHEEGRSLPARILSANDRLQYSAGDVAEIRLQQKRVEQRSACG